VKNRSIITIQIRSCITDADSQCFVTETSYLSQFMGLSFIGISSIILRSLQDFRWCEVKLRSEDSVPETASNAEATLIVGEVMCEMILLQLAVVQRQAFLVRTSSDPIGAGIHLLPMMQKVVSQVVADIAEETATEHRSGRVPVVEEESVRQVPERNRKYGKQSWRHDESVLVHWQVVVNAVKKEMKRDSGPVVREVAKDVSGRLGKTASTNSSRWNRKRCIPYSTNVQIHNPTIQYIPTTGPESPLAARYVPYDMGGSHISGTTHHGVLLNGSRKLPNRGAESPPG